MSSPGTRGRAPPRRSISSSFMSALTSPTCVPSTLMPTMRMPSVPRRYFSYGELDAGAAEYVPLLELSGFRELLVGHLADVAEHVRGEPPLGEDSAAAPSRA